MGNAAGDSRSTVATATNRQIKSHVKIVELPGKENIEHGLNNTPQKKHKIEKPPKYWRNSLH